jgi:hypothetical protein
MVIHDVSAFGVREEAPEIGLALVVCIKAWKVWQ